MGAHLSTVQSTLKERFQMCDAEGKGYLTLSQMMAMQPQFGVSSCHLGVLYMIDRNHDAVFTLEALREFALLAHNYARVHRNQEAAFMVTGYASLKLWSALDRDQQEVVDWVMSLFTKGFATACLLSNKQLVVHQKALKALHILFDMERNHNMSYQALRDMVRNAAAEEQLMDPASPLRDKWIPVAILTVFATAMVDGMANIMESFTSDAAELRDVVRKADAALAEQSRQRGRSSAGGHASLTPLNLKKQLYSIR